MFSIKNILARLETRKSEDADDIDALRESLREAQAAADKARSELAVISRRRPGLLMDDADTQLDKDDRAAEAAHRALEKTEILIPEIRRRIEEAKAAAHRKIAVELQARINSSFEACRSAYEKAAEAHAADQLLRRAIGDQHGEEIFAELRVPEPWLAGYDISQLTRLWLDAAHMRLGIPQPKPAPAKASPKPHANGAAKPAERRAIKPSAPPVSPKPPRLPVLEEPQDGLTQVVVIRGGFENAGRQLYPGDVINLLPEQATAAMRGGSVDTVRPVGGQEARP